MVTNTGNNDDNTVLWLRNETKYGEGRVAITPANALKLIKNGYTIYVERSKTRCFNDIEYEKVGCELVTTNSWPNAPKHYYIVGLKELEPDWPKVLKHRHIMFGHCYKGQNEAIPLLKRFINGNGELLDLEFLVNDQGRRVAAFGVSAGKAGMAMGLLTWAKQKMGESVGHVKPWKSEEAMIEETKFELNRVIKAGKANDLPKIIIIGALGRCGSGAIYVATKCGIPVEYISKWDLEETKKGGPFKEIVFEHDIFVNCIRLMSKFPPFITKEMCMNPNRQLTVVSDIACDPNNPDNPVPVYNESSTVINPVERVIDGIVPLDVTSIDHLPSLIPISSSTEYSDALLPTLMNLNEYTNDPVWKRARDIYIENINKIN